MLGLMQDQPLLISSLISYADRHHGDDRDRVAHRRGRRSTATPIATPTRRARQLANALKRLGIRARRPRRHAGLERLPPSRDLLRASSGIGAVCHTINPRLFPEQIVYIVNHAEDRYVFFDLTFVPLVEKLRPLCKAVNGWVAMTDRAHMPASLPDVLCYEELIAERERHARLAEVRREHGVVALLHLGHHRQPQGRALLASLDGAAFLCRGAARRLNLSARDVILPVVPMFHVNAWGLPYACAAGRREAGVPRRRARRQEPLRAVRGRARHLQRRRADRVAGAAAIHGAGQAPLRHAEAHRDRRLGLPAGDDRAPSRTSTASRCCMPGA